MKPNVWVKTGVVIIYGSSIDATAHIHHAIQVVWPNDETLCSLNGETKSSPFVIHSSVEHQLQLEEGWILLIEPTSELGVKLSHPVDDLPLLLSPLFSALENNTPFSHINKSAVTDKRIQALLLQLHQCLDGDCIKPNQWRASEVAQQLALSESRFLHLFRQELGIPWRPYLLWCRMTCAVQAIMNHTSATDAAHLAGFSDSAHLSRTFRKNFGMTIRQARVLFDKT